MTHAPGPDATAGEPFCLDPAHDELCGCGARPDWAYETQREEEV